MTESPRRTIVLFHRMDLTLLFSELSENLERELNVMHLAYGPKEVLRLKALNVAGDVTVFKDEIYALHETVQPSTALLDEIDRLIVEETGGAFCLNSAIQSDRGFKLLEYADALHLTATYYTFWMQLIEKNDIDFLLHEPCTLMFNFLPALILSRRGGAYLYNIMASGLPGEHFHLTMTGFDFTCPGLERKSIEVQLGDLPVNVEVCDKFLLTFRNSYKVFLGDVIGHNFSLWKIATGAVFHGLRNLRNRQHVDPVLDNIDYWLHSGNRNLTKLVNLFNYSRKIDFETTIPEERYFFYPMHLEPEAVVLYHGHGIYENQVKLVQNIAGQLPPDTWLYVKDHPHETGYRSVSDYQKLAEVPNVRLLDSAIPGKEVIRQALGVITISGTSGFEALLLGKQVYTFAKTFYSSSPRVNYLHHIRDLREALYANRDVTFEGDNDLYPFLTAYLASIQPGLTDYFAGRAVKYKIDLQQNAEKVACSLLATVENL